MATENHSGHFLDADRGADIIGLDRPWGWLQAAHGHPLVCCLLSVMSWRHDGAGGWFHMPIKCFSNSVLIRASNSLTDSALSFKEILEFSHMTQASHFLFSREGNGNPLQCSCQENPRDRGAWWAAVYGVA